MLCHTNQAEKQREKTYCHPTGNTKGEKQEHMPVNVMYLHENFIQRGHRYFASSMLHISHLKYKNTGKLHFSNIGVLKGLYFEKIFLKKQWIYFLAKTRIDFDIQFCQQTGLTPPNTLIAAYCFYFYLKKKKQKQKNKGEKIKSSN